MANIYVNNAGSNTSPYDTWAKAATTLAAAAAIDAAGDTIWVRSTHSESTGSALSYSWAGTVASPVRIICVSDSGEPPTTVATGAVVATTGASSITPSTAGHVYFYGIRFQAGNSTNAASINVTGSNDITIYDNCAFELAGNNSSSKIATTVLCSVSLISCSFKFANASSSIAPAQQGSGMRFINCSWESGGTAPSTLFVPNGVSADADFIGCDFSNLGSSSNLITSAFNASLIRFVNCKLPASWSGSLNTANPGVNSLSILQNCDSADTNYRIEYKDLYGATTHDTSIYRTSGASDGTTNISWKMVSNTNAKWIQQVHTSPEIVRWNETTGSSVTVTVEFLIDSATTLNNNDVWMEVQYLGTSGTPLGSVDMDSRCATYLTTAAECATGTGTANWTGEGGSAKSYKCTSTFTPQEKGFIHAVIKLAKASTTIYVDPVLTVS